MDGEVDRCECLAMPPRLVFGEVGSRGLAAVTRQIHGGAGGMQVLAPIAQGKTGGLERPPVFVFSTRWSAPRLVPQRKKLFQLPKSYGKISALFSGCRMARDSNPFKTELITLSLNVQTVWYLDRLVETGLYGNNRTEAARVALYDHCKLLIADQKLGLVPPPREATRDGGVGVPSRRG